MLLIAITVAKSYSLFKYYPAIYNLCV